VCLYFAVGHTFFYLQIDYGLDTISLYELNSYIKQVYALNFEEPVWIKAEISQCRLSKGHWYVELVQKDLATQLIIAQSSAVIWAGDYRNLQRTIGSEIDGLLKVGSEVKIMVEVTYHERYGPKLIIRNIDLEFTLGTLELQKRAILAKLEAENLLTLNKKNILPPLVQRIAVISSPTAAGYKDFIAQLNNNEYGFDYYIKLFEASMQGAKVRADICHQLTVVDAYAFDCIVIIRGGGSKLDLVEFDDFELAKTIALSEIPVITGIGHEIDVSIADLVAHTSLKTPTAVASYLISRSLEQDRIINQFGGDLIEILQNSIFKESMRLSDFQSNIHRLSSHHLQRTQSYLLQSKKELELLVKHIIAQSTVNTSHLNERLSLLDYRNILKRGYSFLVKNNKVVKSVNEIQKEEEITQILADGEVLSKIIDISYGKEDKGI